MKEEISHGLATVAPAVPTGDKEKHIITSLFLSHVNEHVTTCDNGRKVVHCSTTNLARVNRDKKHTEQHPTLFTDRQSLGMPVLFLLLATLPMWLYGWTCRSVGLLVGWI